MDKRLEAIMPQDSSIEAIDYAGGVEAGFRFAIQRLRENEYYGHYAKFLANWLEKHLEKDVKSDKATDK